MIIFIFVVCQLHCLFLFHDVKKKNANLWIITNHCDKCQKRNSKSKKHCFYFFKMFIYVMLFLWFMLFFFFFWICQFGTVRFVHCFYFFSVQQSNVSVSMLNDTVWTWGSFVHGASSVVTDETHWHHNGVMCLRMVCPHPHLPAHCQWFARATK